MNVHETPVAVGNAEKNEIAPLADGFAIIALFTEKHGEAWVASALTNEIQCYRCDEREFYAF